MIYGTSQAVKKAFEAGNDIIIFRFNENEEKRAITNIIKLSKTGKIKIGRLNRSVKRIIKMKEKYDISDERRNSGN